MSTQTVLSLRQEREAARDAADSNAVSARAVYSAASEATRDAKARENAAYRAYTRQVDKAAHWRNLSVPDLSRLATDPLLGPWLTDEGLHSWIAQKWLLDSLSKATSGALIWDFGFDKTTGGVFDRLGLRLNAASDLGAVHDALVLVLPVLQSPQDQRTSEIENGGLRLTVLERFRPSWERPAQDRRFVRVDSTDLARVLLPVGYRMDYEATGTLADVLVHVAANHPYVPDPDFD